MEMKNAFSKAVSVVMLMVILVSLTGCGKTFRDYDNAWVSEDPYIYISAKNSDNPYYAEIEIDNEIVYSEFGYAHNGTRIIFYEVQESETGSYSDDDITIWDTSVKIKNGKMYLTVDVDNYGDNEGKTFVLEQQDLSGES